MVIGDVVAWDDSKIILVNTEVKGKLTNLMKNIVYGEDERYGVWVTGMYEIEGDGGDNKKVTRETFRGVQ